ncbi:MAG TPA: hypothetical protein VFG55_04395 [Rhodanobacteraceae bacterium]|nr:hypothetical protein [Rhodanobacteraceae bacterium]
MATTGLTFGSDAKADSAGSKCSRSVTMNRLFPLLATAILATPFAYAGHGGGHDYSKKLQMMDSNHDGQISAAEHAAAASAMFEKMDLNKDGSTDATEMAAAHDQMRKEKETERISALDTNGDGTVSMAEHGAAAQARFARMDTNGDGSLSRAEIDAAHAAKMDKQPKQ